MSGRATRFEAKIIDPTLPLNGRKVEVLQCDWDSDFLLLCGWNLIDDREAMLTSWQVEKESDVCHYNTLEEFIKAWNNWELPPFVLLRPEQVEICQELGHVDM